MTGEKLWVICNPCSKTYPLIVTSNKYMSLFPKYYKTKRELGQSIRYSDLIVIWTFAGLIQAGARCFFPATNI
jgi:hypothetical protein